MEEILLSSWQQGRKEDNNNNADSRTVIECQKVEEVQQGIDMTRCSSSSSGIMKTNDHEKEEGPEFNQFKSILSSSTEELGLATISCSDTSASLLLLQQPSSMSISLPYRVAHCQELCRYLMAAKDLDEGEIILQEFPITSGPERDSTLICPGCYEEPHESYACRNCGWPLCGPKCPEISRHQMECKLLSERYNNNDNHKLQSDKKKSKNYWKQLSEYLMIIRCLSLKYYDPSKWKRLLQMETNYEQWSRSPLYERAEETIQLLREEFDIVDEERFTFREMLTIQAVLDINAYEVRMPYTNIQASYAEASLAEHNCVPNMHKTINSKTLQLTLRAAADIPKGTHLTTSYCDILWSTAQRQQYLQWSKFFICKCKRCSDPTELGSLLSALICPLCPNESLVLPNLTGPDNGLEERGSRLSQYFNFDYYCTICSTRFPANQVQSILLKAEEQLQELDKDQSVEKTAEYQEWMARWTLFPAKDFGLTTNNTNWMWTTVPDDSTKDMESKKMLPKPNVYQDKNVDSRSNGEHEKILPQSSKNSSSSSPPLQLLLHSQHSIILDACHTLFLLLATEESATDEELEQKIQLGIHLIESTRLIFTGISKFRATVMSEIATAKMTTLIRLLERQDLIDEMTKQLAQDSIDMLKASIEMLKYEPLDQPEGILAQTCISQLTQLTSFLENLDIKTF